MALPTPLKENVSFVLTQIIFYSAFENNLLIIVVVSIIIVLCYNNRAYIMVQSYPAQRVL